VLQKFSSKFFKRKLSSNSSKIMENHWWSS